MFPGCFVAETVASYVPLYTDSASGQMIIRLVDYLAKSSYTDDAMAWKRFLYQWPFVKEIHRSLLDTLYKGPAMRSFIFFAVILN